MNRFLGFFLAVSLFFPPLLSSQSYPLDRDVDVLHYRFHLTLSDTTDRILGKAEITMALLAEGAEAFSLDLVGRDREGETGMEVLQVSRGSQPLEFAQEDGKLTIFLTSPSRRGEERTFTVAYEGIPADGLIIGTNMYGDRTFFGDNWPDRARHWLPTVDHVSDKATVEWIVTAPGHYEVVGNGRLIERSNLGDGSELTHWETVAPIAPKVMVIGVARFAMKNSAFFGGIPVQAWVYPQAREAGFHDFALAEKALSFFQEVVGPFPYAKLANVQSKTRYGGMENASNVFYSERAVRGDRRNEGLIVHEIAHQWFGDSVTELDWNHLWLSEGFATYLTHLYNEATYGRERLVEGMQRDRRTVARFLSERPGLALVPPGYDDPNETLNPNAYQKGGWLLHMLRRQLGDEAFWEGIRAYYHRYRDRNALTDDFQAVMEEAGGEELGWFFRQWAYQPGHPVLEGEWRYDSTKGELMVTLRQVQRQGGPFRFPMDLGVEGADGRTISSETVRITDRSHTFSFSLGTEPKDVVLDPDTWLLFEGGFTKEAGGGP